MTTPDEKHRQKRTGVKEDEQHTRIHVGRTSRADGLTAAASLWGRTSIRCCCPSAGAWCSLLVSAAPPASPSLWPATLSRAGQDPAEPKKTTDWKWVQIASLG